MEAGKGGGCQRVGSGRVGKGSGIRLSDARAHPQAAQRAQTQKVAGFLSETAAEAGGRALHGAGDLRVAGVSGAPSPPCPAALALARPRSPR